MHFIVGMLKRSIFAIVLKLAILRRVAARARLGRHGVCGVFGWRGVWRALWRCGAVAGRALRGDGVQYVSERTRS